MVFPPGWPNARQSPDSPVIEPRSATMPHRPEILMSRPFAPISIFSVRGASRGNEMGLISSGRERAAAAVAPIQSKHALTPLRRLYDSYLLVMLLVYLTRNSLISF